MATDFLNLDDLEAEANLAPYVVRLGGTKHELPNFGALTVEQANHFDEDRERVLREVAGDEFTDLALKLKLNTFNKLLQGWMRHAGSDPGEGRASASS